MASSYDNMFLLFASNAWCELFHFDLQCIQTFFGCYVCLLAALVSELLAKDHNY